MQHHFLVHTFDELDMLSEKLINLSDDIRIFLFNGDLGAGKTTFIKSLTKFLGVREEVSSPTFSIIKEYKDEKEAIYHLDLYRIKSFDELEEIGIFEYLDSGSYCFIEWPDIIEPYLDMDYAVINMSILENKSRNITLDLFKNIS